MIERQSSNALAASSNETPCFFRFDLAFASSHSKFTATGVYVIRHARERPFGRLARVHRPIAHVNPPNQSRRVVRSVRHHCTTSFPFNMSMPQANVSVRVFCGGSSTVVT